MMRITLIFFIFLSHLSSAQVYPQIGARSNGLGGASLTLDDVWSVYNNPGAFGYLDKSGIGASYENRFLLAQLSTQSMVFGYHTEKAGNFGIHFQHYGFDMYREMQGGLSYGMKFFDNFSAGVSLNFHRIALGDIYGSKNSFSAGLGLMYDLNEQFRFGMRVLNLNRARLAVDYDERLPTTFSLGARYAFSKKAFWTLDVEKDLIHKLNVRSGIEIQAHDIFAVRIGMNTYPFQASVGFGLKFKSLYIDMATNWHTQLGISPAGSLHFCF
ncbi:hypothetical protein K6119_16970 [Paracrocinitomix mangrovi]|uniref:hypothetical protein n=1 Tax=Paracrocinitomix mangrovi TaxID=2862509 RepID=UPI001C8DAD8B|nr:hypothetical protein [Paracrocinitomix mangrovi]UKN01419.1 hypothetical protein K6119_16970 [Paracrocinitomix mangrovi]